MTRCDRTLNKVIIGKKKYFESSDTRTPSDLRANAPAVAGRESTSWILGGMYEDSLEGERLENMGGNPGRTREDLFGIVPLEASGSLSPRDY